MPRINPNAPSLLHVAAPKAPTRPATPERLTPAAPETPKPIASRDQFVGGPVVDLANKPARKQVTLDAVAQPTAMASATPEELAAAGTLSAKDLKLPEGRVVEGPSAFDDNSHAALPGKFEQAVEKGVVWFTFGLANRSADRLRLGGEATHLPLPRIKGADMEKLTEAGPNGEPPTLQAGDFIVNGADGHAGHLSVYVGKDPASGKPMIIHAMADAEGQQSYLQQVGHAVEAPFKDTGKVGVIKEGLGEFFDRYPRDTAYVVRDPRLTPEMKQKGMERIQGLVGKPYDYSLNFKNDAYYCSEMAVEFEKAAYQDSGVSKPWVGTSWVSEGVWPAKIEQWVATPQNFSVSPDFQLAWANEPGKQDWLHNQENYVVGAPR